jgi:diguanylate cyclase (GGDEF)-like protein
MPATGEAPTREARDGASAPGATPAFDLDQAGPLTGPGRASRVLPFSLVAFACLAATLVPPGLTRPGWFAAATVLLAAIAVAALTVPWDRLPVHWQVAPALLFFPVVVLARQAAGGSDSRLGGLVLVPVVWIALYHGRRWASVGVATAAVVLGGPTLLDVRGYTDSDWRATIVLTAVAILVCLSVQSLVRSLTAGRRRAEELAHRLHRSETNLRVVADVVRRAQVPGADARHAVCTGAAALANAQMAWLMEPDGEGHLVDTGSTNSPVSPIRLAVHGDDSGVALAFREGRERFVPDAGSSPYVSRGLVEVTGTHSVYYAPVRDGETTLAVLVVAWTDQVSPDVALLDGLRLLVAESANLIQREDAVRRLRDAARVDPLTGVANRRVLDEALKVEVARAARGQVVTVALLDLDHFKRFNDQHGHVVGDQLLREATAAWISVLRVGDLLARYGGEEFCVVLRDTGASEAAEVMERMRALMPRGQTVSVGLSRVDPQDDVQSLMTRVDAALYAAKRGGRDRVTAA